MNQSLSPTPSAWGAEVQSPPALGDLEGECVSPSETESKWSAVSDEPLKKHDNKPLHDCARRRSHVTSLFDQRDGRRR